jgi:hypothetical protein
LSLKVILPLEALKRLAVADIIKSKITNKSPKAVSEPKTEAKKLLVKFI